MPHFDSWSPARLILNVGNSPRLFPRAILSLTHGKVFSFSFATSSKSHQNVAFKAKAIRLHDNLYLTVEGSRVRPFLTCFGCNSFATVFPEVSLPKLSQPGQVIKTKMCT